MAAGLFVPIAPSALHLQGEGVRLSVEELGAGGVESRARWLELFGRDRHAGVFHHPDYAGAFAEKGLRGVTITALRGGVAEAMAILIPKRCRLGGQALPGARSRCDGVRLAGSALLGSQDPAVVQAVVESMATELRRRRIAVLEFEAIDEASALWQAVKGLGAKGFRFAPTDAFDLHHRITLKKSAEEFWKGFNSKHRLRMRKEREKFGAYKLRLYSASAEVDEWLTAAHDISRKSWQTGRLGLRIQNSEEDRRFLNFLAQIGAWRSYILFREETPAAFALGFQWRGVFHYDEIGFDRSLIKLYPGKVMLQEILTDLMTHDHAEVFDFGLGDAEYKRFFANQQGRSAKLWMFPPGLRSRWQAGSMNLRRKLGRETRRWVARMSWYERLRTKWRNASVKGGEGEPPRHQGTKDDAT
jgi:CelD/BcsL family acetyltransferase involved in cellulose biosynthesis